MVTKHVVKSTLYRSLVLYMLKGICACRDEVIILQQFIQKLTAILQHMNKVVS